MQQRAHRGRRHHGRRQPAVERHHRGLADAEEVERHQHRHHDIGDLAGEDAALGEVEGPGAHPGQPHGQELEADGGAQQDPQVGAPRPLRLGRAGVGDQRIGADGEHLVEGEEGQHVARERDPHGAGQRHREEGVEAGLVVLVVAAHVADGVERGRDPQQAGGPGEGGAQRLGGERQAEAREHLHQRYLGALAGDHGRQHHQHQREERHRRDQGHALAQVRPRPGEPDEKRPHRGHDQRQNHRRLGPHGASPMRDSAVASARSMVQLASTPKTTQAAARITSGTSMASGASRTSPRPSGTGRK